MKEGRRGWGGRGTGGRSITSRKKKQKSRDEDEGEEGVGREMTTVGRMKNRENKKRDISTSRAPETSGENNTEENITVRRQ